jgi:hypothetical protein
LHLAFKSPSEQEEDVMLNKAVVAVLAVAVMSLPLFGCASAGVKPMVWRDQQAVFTDYPRSLEVWPVFNATDLPAEPAALVTLTELLERKLLARNLDIVKLPEATGGGLVLQSDLLVYIPYEHINVSAFMADWQPGWGRASCTLRSRLVDKATSRMVAEITVVKVANAGNPYIGHGGRYKAHEWILQEAAAAVAAEVDKLMSGDI